MCTHDCQSYKLMASDLCGGLEVFGSPAGALCAWHEHWGISVWLVDLNTRSQTLSYSSLKKEVMRSKHKKENANTYITHAQMCVCECVWTESEHNTDGFGLFIKGSIILFNQFILFPHNNWSWGYTDWPAFQNDSLALLWHYMHTAGMHGFIKVWVLIAVCSIHLQC